MLPDLSPLSQGLVSLVLGLAYLLTNALQVVVPLIFIDEEISWTRLLSPSRLFASLFRFNGSKYIILHSIAFKIIITKCSLFSFGGNHRVAGTQHLRIILRNIIIVLDHGII